MGAIRAIVQKALSQFPDNGKAVKARYYSLRMKKDLVVSEVLRYFSGATLPPKYEIFMIDPVRIEYHTTLKNENTDWEGWVFKQNVATARVVGGDWDEPLHRVANMRVVKAVKARIDQGVSWSSTEYYCCAVKQIESGRLLWKCATRYDFDQHCVRLDNLIRSVKAKGYQKCADPGDGKAHGGFSEIVVNLGRDGVPRFQDGRHRLAIALALHLKQVPIQVLVRHQEWQTFREFMHRMAKGDGGTGKGGVFYQAPRHFDLSDISYEHACEDRWDAIQNTLPAKPGIALDIGCNLGFVCHCLHEVGYQCVGVEYFPDIAMAAKKIAIAERLDIKIITGDILAPETLNAIGTLKFSVVMALNIFHHFIKSKDGYERLSSFLRRIDAEVMYFEPHLPNEPQMEGAYINPAPLEFVRLIQDWGGFEKVTPIFQAEDGRSVFKLEKMNN